MAGKAPRKPVISDEDKEAVRSTVRSGAALTREYLIMNALATVVASYGLLSNSTAVVIGAMIIALLLGPITGIALGLVDGDNALLRKSLVAEFVGVLTVMVVALIIGLIHRDLPLQAELLSRTSPNILDLMIALAGGAAGAYATVSPNLSVGLVGVAIATALVPPLATCSICLARGDLQLASGGFLLFLANLVAIQFASSVVMWLYGFRFVFHRVADLRTYIGRISASLGLLLILAVVLGLNFARSVAREGVQDLTRNRLDEALHNYPGVFLADLRFVPEESKTLVFAVIRSPYSFGPSQVGQLQAKLPKFDGRVPELHVRSVITKEATIDGYLHELRQPAEPRDSEQEELSGNN